jgi:hypothetical protein
MKVGDMVKPKPGIWGGPDAYWDGHPQNYIGLVINVDNDDKAPGCIIVLNPKDGSLHQWHISRLRFIA